MEKSREDVPGGAENWKMPEKADGDTDNSPEAPIETSEALSEGSSEQEPIKVNSAETDKREAVKDTAEPKHEYTPQEIRDIGEGIKNFFERMDASREEQELREVFKSLIERLNRLSKEQQDRAKALLAIKAKEAHSEEGSLKDAYTKIIDLMTRMIEIIDSNVK